MYLIYSGKFNPEEKNEVFAQSHFDLYEKSLNERIEKRILDFTNNIERNKEKRKDKSSPLYSIIPYMIKYFFLGLLYDEAILVPNPYYNTELVERYLNPDDYHPFLIGFGMGYAPSELKKYRDKMLKSDKNDEYKREGIIRFNGGYSKRKEILCGDEFNDLIKIDFDNL